jgi:hypothetical protein
MEYIAFNRKAACGLNGKTAFLQRSAPGPCSSLPTHMS